MAPLRTGCKVVDLGVTTLVPRTLEPGEGTRTEELDLSLVPAPGVDVIPRRRDPHHQRQGDEIDVGPPKRPKLADGARARRKARPTRSRRAP